MDRRLMLRALALLLVLGAPLSARGQAVSADFQTPPLSINGSTIANQWDNLILGHQGLATYFEAKVASGTEPNDVLQGIMLGLRSQSTTRKDWRIITTSDDAVVLEQNTGSDASPSWVERFRVNSTGPTSAPAAHTHAAADTVSGAFASARISQASVEQWAVQTPAASRIPIGNVSAQLESGWIPQNGVTQYQNALQINANQVIAGQFDDARLKLTNITQFGYLLQTGDIFMRASASCPSGTTEVTGARAAKLVGADTAGSSANYPDSAGILCRTGSLGSGCLAPSGNNYNDTQESTELFLHTHTGPSHSHTVTLTDHTHTGPSHTHTMAHTHDVDPDGAGHSHDAIVERANSDTINPNNHFVGDGNETGTLQTFTGASGQAVQTTDLASVTSGASSAANTGASGTGATGLAGAGTFGSSTSGTGNTGSTGGTDPNVGPIFSVRLCQVN